MNKKRYLYTLNRKLHRDIGFLCVGLTLLYSISGFFLNHAHDMNPNYHVAYTKLITTEFNFFVSDKEEIVKLVRKNFQINNPFLSSHWPSENEFRIFFKDLIVTIYYDKKEIFKEQIKPRILIKELNSLHVNDPKKIWTVLADTYAVALGYLAISGIFMVKGKFGIFGRGGILIIAGFLIPIIINSLAK